MGKDWLKGFKCISTKKGKGAQATYEKGERGCHQGPIFIYKNTEKLESGGVRDLWQV